MKTHGIAESIKQEIAAAIVRESQPGYMRSYTGESYVVDMDGDQEFDAVIFKGATAQWNPWPDNVTALAVQDLYQHCEGDVDFTIEDGDDPELAEQLALEYMPDYYPPFDTNDDDDEGEEEADDVWEQADSDPYQGAQADSDMAWDKKVAEYERSIGLRNQSSRVGAVSQPPRYHHVAVAAR